MMDSTENSYFLTFIISGSVGRDSTKGAGYLLLLSGNVFPPRKTSIEETRNGSDSSDSQILVAGRF